MNINYKKTAVWLTMTTMLLFSGYVLLALLTTPAKAAVTIPVTRDDFAFTDDIRHIDNVLVVRANANADTSCSVDGVTYLGFDVSSIDASSTILTATLDLSPRPFSITGASMVMSLWGVTDDSWTEGETDIAFATRPTVVTELGSFVTTPIFDPDTINFSTTSAFATFIDDQVKGDGFATLAIQPREGTIGDCPTISSIAGQSMDSQESTAINHMAPAGLTLEGVDPLAVTLLSIDVSTQTSNILVWVAGIMFVLVLVAMALMLRRKPTEQMIA